VGLVVVVIVELAWPKREFTPGGRRRRRRGKMVVVVGMVVRRNVARFFEHFWSHDLRIFPSHDIFRKMCRGLPCGLNKMQNLGHRVCIFH